MRNTIEASSLSGAPSANQRIGGTAAADAPKIIECTRHVDDRIGPDASRAHGHRPRGDPSTAPGLCAPTTPRPRVTSPSRPRRAGVVRCLPARDRGRGACSCSPLVTDGTEAYTRLLASALAATVMGSPMIWSRSMTPPSRTTGAFEGRSALARTIAPSLKAARADTRSRYGRWLTLRRNRLGLAIATVGF